MKSVPALVVLAALALVLFTGSTPVPAQPPKAARYEYKFLPLTHGAVQNDEQTLNEMAADGWELVAATSSARGMPNVTSDTRLVLKRQKR